MIWNGTDPLQPDHEVAYRGWPTERVHVCNSFMDGPWNFLAVNGDLNFATQHNIKGHHGPFGISPYDLIPLQQEPAK